MDEVLEWLGVLLHRIHLRSGVFVVATVVDPRPLRGARIDRRRLYSSYLADMNIGLGLKSD